MTYMCDKPGFDRAQNEATKLLLRQNINSLFIDVKTFVFDRRILIDSVQNYANVVGRSISDFVCDRFSGCCVIPYSRCNLVLYDDSESNDCRKHWGIAHEIGHIYLEHQTDGEKEEKEAHFFAAQTIAPEIVLWDIYKRKGVLFCGDLLAHFNMSYKAATKRVSTLNNRRCYNSDLIDKELLKKFSPALDREFSPNVRVS